MSDAGRPRYKRVLLKLSGEALMSDRRSGIDPETLASIADEIVDVQKMGVEIAIVIGGGHRLRRGAPRQRAELRDHLQGHAGRRHLHVRSEEGPERATPPLRDVPARARGAAAGDGRGGDRRGPELPDSDLYFFAAREGEHP